MVDQQLQLVTLHVDGGQGRVPATDEEATLVRGSGGGGRQGGEVNPTPISCNYLYLKIGIFTFRKFKSE